MHAFGVMLKNKEIQIEGGDMISCFQNGDVRHQDINLVHFITPVSLLAINPAAGLLHTDSVHADCRADTTLILKVY